MQELRATRTLEMSRCVRRTAAASTRVHTITERMLETEAHLWCRQESIPDDEQAAPHTNCQSHQSHHDELAALKPTANPFSPIMTSQQLNIQVSPIIHTPPESFAHNSHHSHTTIQHTIANSILPIIRTLLEVQTSNSCKFQVMTLRAENELSQEA